MNLTDKLKTLLFYFKPRKVLAMYKLYFGDEWLECSVNSVAGSVYRIVLMISDVPWGENAAIEGDDLDPVIERLRQKHGQKIVVHRGSWNKQLDHVKAGLQFIRQQFPQATHLLYVDSDEVYPAGELRKLLKLMYSWRYFNRAIRVQYNMYFKTIYCRIMPRLWSTATALIPLRHYTDFIDPRNVLTVNAIDRPDIVYEHFAYVRKSDEKIRRKIEAHRETEPILGDWYHDVWLRWTPAMRSFHPTQPELWQHAEEVAAPQQLPDIVATYESWKVHSAMQPS
jgi:hypothetical protein